MKLLVFAHTPPPFHGQSYMVQLMIEGFGGDVRSPLPSGVKSPIHVYHVNARLSDSIDDIGGIRPGKLFKLLGYCLQAIFCRFRYGVRTFYYVPAPPKRSALYRDWLVMLLCRPFFGKIVFHWEAMGLGQYLGQPSSRPGGLKSWERWLTKKLLGGIDLSIALTCLGQADCEALSPRRVQIVPNGIVDPCPDFDRTVAPLRQERFNAWSIRSNSSNSATIEVLFMAHCTREKGLFDAIDAIALANAELVRRKSELRFHLTVAGEFMKKEERTEFEERTKQSDLLAGEVPAVHYVGFATGAAKNDLLRNSDCLCFPTYYSGEAFPVLLIEALAWGLAIVSTEWRGLPEILGPSFPCVPPRDPPSISQALLEVPSQSKSEKARSLFLARYTHLHYQQGLTSALLQP